MIWGVQIAIRGVCKNRGSLNYYLCHNTYNVQKYDLWPSRARISIAFRPMTTMRIFEIRKSKRERGEKDGENFSDAFIQIKKNDRKTPTPPPFDFAFSFLFSVQGTFDGS
jgi:hypothetical protein